MQDKKKKTNIKVRDLQPKKDAKGGMVANVHTSNSSKFNAGTSSKFGVQANQQSVNQSVNRG